MYIIKTVYINKTKEELDEKVFKADKLLQKLKEMCSRLESDLPKKGDYKQAKENYESK